MLAACTVSPILLVSSMHELADWFSRNEAQGNLVKGCSDNLHEQLMRSEPKTIPYEHAYPFVQVKGAKRHLELVYEASQWVKDLDIFSCTLTIMILLFENEERLKNKYLRMLHHYIQSRKAQLDPGQMIKRIVTLVPKLEEMRTLRLPP